MLEVKKELKIYEMAACRGASLFSAGMNKFSS